ncbi:MAG: thiamine phosphate synthase [Gemmatimonadetes bacterium]|nr:thiamine phosphate synthase [Gemmatimonadota bacterium]
MTRPRLPRLHLVTDASVVRAPDFLRHAEGLLAAHGPAIALHLRAHGLRGGELCRLGVRLAAASRAAAALFLVNDRVDVCQAVRAHGVQLGRRSIPLPAARKLLGDPAWIGYSAHAAEEAHQMAEDADFLMVGSVYPSASHGGAPAAGPELVAAVCRRVGRPVLAIGGITPDRAADVLAAGACGVAVLGGVWRAVDPVAAAGEFLAALDIAPASRRLTPQPMAKWSSSQIRPRTEGVSVDSTTKA